MTSSFCIESVDYRVLNMRARMPFRYGIATLTALPHLFVRVEAEVDGRRQVGIAAEGLPPKWFTKDPNTTFRQELGDMLAVIRQAGELAAGGGAAPTPPNFEGGGTPARGLLDGTAGPSRVSLSNSGPGQGGYQVHDEYVTAAAVDWLNRHAIQRHSLSGSGGAEGAAGGRATDGGATPSVRPEPVEGPGDQPFLLSVGFMLPHQPFVARRDEYERYRGRVPAPRHPNPSQPEHPYLRWWRERAGIESVSGEELERTRTAYWALVDRLDALIGQVVRALEENGLAENTLILYTTDHGEQAGEHGLWWKQTMYEASSRVPLLLSWPGVIPAGQRCARVVSALDATATILDAAGAPALPDMRGRSLLGLVGADESRLMKDQSGLHAAVAGNRAAAPAPTGPRRPPEPLLTVPRPSSADWEDIAFSEFCVEEGWFNRVVRSGPWKLVYYHGYRPQLFNLAEDPGEERDLAEDPTHASVRAELTARVLDGWDPDRISAAWQLKKQQSQVLRSWARATRPADQYRWDMPPDVNYLDVDPVRVK